LTSARDIGKINKLDKQGKIVIEYQYFSKVISITKVENILAHPVHHTWTASVAIQAIMKSSWSGVLNQCICCASCSMWLGAFIVYICRLSHAFELYVKYGACMNQLMQKFEQYSAWSSDQSVCD